MSRFKKRAITSDAPLGAQLKAVRRTAGLSLRHVAEVTKIRKQFLQAIEEGKYDELPAEVYAKGFIENYAKFLGFPVDEVLLQYKRERGLTGKPTSVLEVPRRTSTGPQLTITPKTMWLAAGVLSFLIAVGYIVSQVSGFATAAKLEIAKPTVNATVNTETTEVEGKTDIGAQVAINNQPVPTDPDGGFREKVRLLSGTNTLKISAKNKTGKEKVVTRTVIAQLPKSAGASSPTPAAGGLLMTVKIGPGSAYVTVSVDGNVSFQGLLTPNTEQTFLALSRILLTTSNAGSTRVLLNGQDQGVVGKDGQARKGIEYLVPTPSPSPTPGK